MIGRKLFYFNLTVPVGMDPYMARPPPVCTYVWSSLRLHAVDGLLQYGLPDLLQQLLAHLRTEEEETVSQNAVMSTPKNQCDKFDFPVRRFRAELMQ